MYLCRTLADGVFKAIQAKQKLAFKCHLDQPSLWHHKLGGLFRYKKMTSNTDLDLQNFGFHHDIIDPWPSTLPFSLDSPASVMRTNLKMVCMYILTQLG